jgi:hypothetical protein
MTARVIKHLCVLICATASPVPVHAAESSARCYLIPWRVVFRASPSVEQVRQWALVRCTITTPAELRRLRAILQLEKLRSSAPETRDLRLVVDFVHPDDTVETYSADRFYLTSADLRQSRPVGDGFRHKIESYFRSCSPESSNQAMQLTASKPEVLRCSCLPSCAYPAWHAPSARRS